MGSKAYRDTFRSTGWHYARFRRGYPDAVFELLRQKFGLDGTGRLLDLGCGTGQLAMPLAREFEEVVAMDPEPEMLSEAVALGRGGGSRTSSGGRRGPPTSRTCGRRSARSGW